MENLTQREWAALLLKLNKRRMNKLTNASYDFKGFDISTKDGSCHFTFADHKSKKALIDAMKDFIDTGECIEYVPDDEIDEIDQIEESEEQINETDL